MKNALIIPIYNRPHYVRQCFESLSKLTTWPDIISLVDDGSTDPQVSILINEFVKMHSKKVQILTSAYSENKGVRHALKVGIDFAIHKGATTIINLDSDAIVTPDFVERLMALKNEFPSNIVSGFNHVSNANWVISSNDNYCFKPFLNGINMCFDAEQYKKHVKLSLESVGNWDFNLNQFFFSKGVQPYYPVTKPSCVQHIGMESSMGHSGNGQKPDTAQDFKPLSLPDVTLFGIDAHDQQGINRAAEISQRDIRFGAMKVITQRLFPGATLQEGRTNYSKFMIKNLHEHFNTSHVLTIHADGYVVNWKAWDNDWLQYDFIGATWGYKDNMNVGNGGFSLRSKKLCEILSKLQIEQCHPEDDVICRRLRPMLEKDYGIKFAPEEVANKFSIEGYGANCFPKGNYYAGSFGFHSKCVNFSESEIPKDLWLK